MRPTRRLRELTVFFRLEISWVFAGSPRYLLLGPKPTRELLAVRYGATLGDLRADTDGVARLETSFVICVGVSERKSNVHQVDGINIRHPRLDSVQQLSRYFECQNPHRQHSFWRLVMDSEFNIVGG